jgi:hypothetical protein
MKTTTSALLTAIALCTSACSTESAKQVTFESLQGAGQQMCQKNASSTCQPRENYDDYQRNRKEIVSGSQ